MKRLLLERFEDDEDAFSLLSQNMLEDAMSSVMVTGRMDSRKKQRGLAILEREGSNASQAINRMFDRIIESNSAEFLFEEKDASESLRAAASFVDSLSEKRVSRFDSMSKEEIKRERLSSRGVI